jgi:hypothetical protein
MSQTGTNSLFWAGTVLWVILWAVFVARLAWLTLDCASTWPSIIRTGGAG